jgi:hypothetical protein
MELFRLDKSLIYDETSYYTLILANMYVPDQFPSPAPVRNLTKGHV